MKAGNVVSIRVNPTDCMAVVDVIKKTGVYTPGMSFAQMVSLALSGVLQTLRDTQLIPDREGWEYNELVGPYINKQNGRKLEVTKVINSIGSELKVSGLSKPTQTVGGMSTWAKFQELAAKKEQAELGVGIWTDEDQVAFDKVASLV